MSRFRFIIAALIAASVGSQSFAGSLEPSLEQALRSSKKSNFEVVVFLSNQQGHEAAELLRPQFEGELNAAAGQLAAIQVLLRPRGTMSRSQEDAAAANLAGRIPTNAELAIAWEMDRVRNQYIRAISDELRSRYAADHQGLDARIRQVGGSPISRIWAVNAMTASVPANRIRELADDDSVAFVALIPASFPELSTSTTSLGANAFWTAGFTGGAFDGGVLDVSAVQQALPGFAGKRFESNVGAVDGNGHPTNCAGIMCSVDATFKGVAHGLDTIVSSSTANMMGNMNWMVTQTVEKPENINYSIGNGTASGTDYVSVDQFFDAVVDTFGIMVSKSTGNNGFGSGAPTITRPATAYNLLACASINDFGNTSRTDDRISSFSSRGPTPGGRKKPDITAPGDTITTLARTGGTTTGSGTSFSAPHVGGSIILLMHRGVPNPMIAKAILLNTTDAMNDFDTSATGDDQFVNGSLWNRRYGWGYSNLNRALLHATDWFEQTLNAPPSGGRTFKLFKGPMLAFDKTTVTWNRHVGYNGAANPTIIRNHSNLDLFGYNRANNALLGSSTSAIDNVEQFHVTTAADVVVKVATNGLFDPAVTTERFALATEEGFTAATGPILNVSANGTQEFLTNSVGTIGVVVTNDGDLPAFNVVLTSLIQSPLGGNNVNLGTILPGESKVHLFNFNTPAAAGEYATLGSVSSSSYGETFTGLGTGSVFVGG